MDIPPMAVGGQAEFKRMLKQEMVYPSSELESGWAGKVLTSFIVLASGELDSIRILESVSPAIDAEAIRMIKMTQWKPGYLDGKPVSAFKVLKVSFKPGQYKKWAEERNQQPEAKNPGQIYELEETNPGPLFFAGGSLGNFISQNLKYPPQAMNVGVEGTVKVRFVVENTGRVTNVGIEESVGAGCDEEALRVIRNTRWKPGYVGESPVRTQYYVPIVFKMDKIESSKSFFE